jgi:GNAT superfamily N-acetyltransferase
MLAVPPPPAVRTDRVPMTASDPIRIALESPPAPADMQVVMQGLLAYNASRADGETPAYLFVAARDEDGTVRGGLIGGTYLGWLQVQAIWLEEGARGQGRGGALLDAAEAEAVRRGCPRVFLETLTFQALPFYEKRGYTIVSRVDDFPPGGGSRYALTKMLA